MAERLAGVPNYLPKVLALLATLPAGTLNDCDVLHDGWCAALNGTGLCDCEPEVSPRKAPH